MQTPPLAFVADPAPAAAPAPDVDPFSTEFLTQTWPRAHSRSRRKVQLRHEACISNGGVGLANFNKVPLFCPKSLILKSPHPARAGAQHLGVHAFTTWIMERCQTSHLRPGGLGDLFCQVADTGEITQ